MSGNALPITIRPPSSDSANIDNISATIKSLNSAILINTDILNNEEPCRKLFITIAADSLRSALVSLNTVIKRNK